MSRPKTERTNMMEFLSDEACAALLRDASWPQRPRQPSPTLRVAPLSDHQCVEKTIQSLETHDTVFLLQLPHDDAEMVAGTEGVVEAKTGYHKTARCQVGCTDDWFAKPSTSSEVVRFRMRFLRRDERGALQHFLVWKIQMVKEVGVRNQRCGIRWVRQKRESVELCVENCPNVRQGMVIRLCGVHPELDKCHMMKTHETGDVISFTVGTLFFSSKKSSVCGGTVQFVSEIVRGRSLYEIKALPKEEADQWIAPAQLEWPDDTDDTDSEGSKHDPDQTHVADRVPCFPVDVQAFSVANVPHAVCSRAISIDADDWAVIEEDRTKKQTSVHLQKADYADGLNQRSRLRSRVQEDADVASNPPSEAQWKELRSDVVPEVEAPAIREACRSVEKFKLDPRTYLLDYFVEDREMFKHYVLREIGGHDDFGLFLRSLVRKFGQSAVSNAFDFPHLPRPKSTPSEAAQSVATELYWDSDPVYNMQSIMDDRQPSDTAGIIPAMPLREYQFSAVEEIMSRGNCLVSSATGSGKTRIFIEVARRMLMQKPSARVFVVVPTRGLTTQHVENFDEHWFEANGYPVGSYSSDTSASVETMLQKSVVNITADKLKDHLVRKEITFQHIDLLILDEVHHAKGKSGYKAIMDVYHYLNDRQRKQTKVLGLTATAAEGRKAHLISLSFEKLLATLHVPEENVIVITDENEEIRESIPQAISEVIVVEARPDDGDFVVFIRDCVREILINQLPGRFSSLGVSDLNAIRIPSYHALLDNDSCSSQFQQWKWNINSAVQSTGLEPFQKQDIEKAVLAVCAMDEAAQQSKDLGYGIALIYLLNKLKELCTELTEITSQGETLSAMPLSHQIFELVRFSAYLTMLPRSILTSGSAVAQDCGNFPRFLKLTEILDRYKDADDFHGMVFVRTRSMASQICKMLQTSSLKSTMDFSYIVGQSRGEKQTTNTTSCEEEQEQRSTLRRQSEVLSWFKEDGRRVLVTTSVCEEGINVTSCELVVRYSSAVTGKEYTQSRGRARKLNSRFVCIVEKGSKDEEYVRRCQEEEKNSKETLNRCTAALHL